MRAVAKFILFLFWGGFVPVLCGLLPASFLPRGKRRLHLVIVGGFLSTFAIFELCGLPVLFLTPTGDFRLLEILYLAVTAVWIALGLWRCGRSGWIQPPVIVLAAGHALSSRRSTGGKRSEDQKKGTQHFLLADEVFFWCVFGCLLVFQLIMAYTMASYDGDDAYYVAQSVQTWQTGTMYHYVPYTGVTTRLDGRHAMAMLPMWITMLARLCHTHPTIVTHSMLPIVFIPLCDTCFYSLMAALLYDKVNKNRNRKMLPASLCIYAVFQIFGNVSIYTPETFLILRTWQGKTVFAVIIVPTIYTLLLHLAHRLQQGDSVRGVLFMILLLNAAAGLCTSMAPFLTAALLLLGGFFTAIAVRNRKAFWYLIPTCLPNLIYAAILVWIMLPNLLG